jgi:uncharacterized protein DUF5658
MTRRLVCSAAVMMLLSAAPAGAADRDRADAAGAPALPEWAVERVQHRPALLPALYASYGSLQVADLVTTMQAVNAGAHEVNPTMKPAIGSSASMLAIKAATGAGAIYLSERMWKKNRVGAIVLMATVNGVTAAVVAHNMRTARR